jgi:hypothetical protein
MCDDDEESSSGGKKKTEETVVVSASAPDEAVSAVVTTPSAPTSTTTNETLPSGFGLSRLTAEQISNAIYNAVGYTNNRGTDTFLDEDSDSLISEFAVGLGGIDFIQASFRDPTTKAQTILISRIIAWDVAKKTVQNDLWDSGPNRIFTDNGAFTDPWMPGSSAGKWGEIVNDLFWRLYSRPPSSDEVTLVKNTWENIYAQECEETILGNSNDNEFCYTVNDWEMKINKSMRAWTGILYALLSSQEFWHI